QKKALDTPLSTGGEGSGEDAAARMGMGASNVLDRVAASMGDLIAVEPVFQTVADVPHGGVLLALPALLAVGLLHHAHKYFQLPKGYYGLESLFLILAFLALARLPSLEQLRYCAPGEWGKLLGLEHEIVPRLEKEIPNQPTPEQLEADPKLHRFILVFDREGYSPVFLRSLKKKRIACLTYHKYPG
ncbi:MAG: hypothetical protein GY930_23035, partial [bacterium]|nr:hypothetical protein [bacterium]